MQDLAINYLKILIILFFNINTLFAHQSSLSQVVVNNSDNGLKASINIAVKDTKVLLNINSSNTFTNKIIGANTRNIQNIITKNLHFSKHNNMCDIIFTKTPFIYKQTTKNYIQVPFDIKCSNFTRDLTIQYDLLFNDDIRHKALMRFIEDKKEKLILFYNSKRIYTIQTKTKNTNKIYKELFYKGIEHILSGYDHLLFLLSLLLSSVLIYTNNKYIQKENFKSVLLDVTKFVTAFTIAHSVTLALVLYGLITLPSVFIESFIAFSIILVAIHNLRPIILNKLWIYIFFIGLIHGMGFASFLIELGLTNEIKAYSIIAFNLGVEVGQLSFVAVLLPILFIISKTKLYQEKLVYIFSIIIACFGLYWLINILY